MKHTKAVGQATESQVPRPYCLLAELTYRCPLACPYCSNPLKLRVGQELATAEWQQILRQAAQLGVVQVHFSGGEPLVRQDLEALVGTAREHELYAHLITSGVGATAERLARLQASGLDAVQVSLQDAEPTENDVLAGFRSYEAKQQAVAAARRLGFAVTLNVVLHRHNLDRIEQIIALAEAWQVDRLELAHVQYTGWAFRNRGALLPTESQLDRAAGAVAAARERLGTRPEILHVLPDYFQPYPKACLQGWGRVFLTVAPDGLVLPCQSAREIAELSFPNVRDADLESIWFGAEAFRRFRGTGWMREPCASCERREIDWGGCRCQAYLMTGDPASTDPVCHLAPEHHLVELSLAAAAGAPDLVYRSFS